MLDQLGLLDLYELGQLVVAQDSQGTFWWVMEAGATRYLGPFAEAAVDVFRDTVWSWSPWLDPDWPPQV